MAIKYSGYIRNPFPLQLLSAAPGESHILFRIPKCSTLTKLGIHLRFMVPHTNQDRPLANGITREVLENDLLRSALAARNPDIRMVSNETMQFSIRHMLASRPDNAAGEHGVWLFGYGSLLWNPCVPVAQWRHARLYGYHRDFRIRLTHGRGSVDAPGLMLGLVAGGSCHGMAMQLPSENLEHELLLVWRREMITGVYTPVWTTLHCPGATVSAITFVTNTDHPGYCGQLDDDTVIHMLATGGGQLGTAADYLKNTVNHLEESNIADGRLRMLRHEVDFVLRRQRIRNKSSNRI